MKRAHVLFCLVIVALFAQAQPGGQRSKILTDSIYSKELGAWRHYTIYLPGSFDEDTSRKYPILYMLHGFGGTDTYWFYPLCTKDVLDMLIGSGEACEMIAVAPDAGGDAAEGKWNGYFNMPGWSYEDFFFKEFVPHIESKYRAIGDKKHRAITGLSMGGGGTTVYAQRHPDMFCAAYAMSALMDAPTESEQPSENPDDKVRILFRSVQENSAIKYLEESDIEQRAALHSVEWFVDCGDDDFLLERNIEFFRAMKKEGIPLQFRVRDGGHVQEYWHSALYLCLPFVTRCFDK